MRKSFFIIVITLGLTSFSSVAQSFDEEDFIRRLNEALADEGLTISQDGSVQRSNENISTTGFPELRLDVPEYGIAVVGPTGIIEGVFGPSAPIVTGPDGEVQGILGFQAADDVTFQIIGSDLYAHLVTNASATQLDDGFQRAILMMKEAANFVASQLCGAPARPSEITVSVSADFKLVFGASTGTSAKWILAETCDR